MTFVCIALVLTLAFVLWLGSRERRELLRSIQSPQQVIREETPKHAPPERIWTDEQFKRLMKERSQN